MGAMNLDHDRPYFNMNIAACRAAGTRGGRRSARNRRVHRLAQPPVRTASCPQPEQETAHQASMLLDERFPHLRNAWVRTTLRRVA